MALLVSVINPFLRWGQDFIHEEILQGSTCDLQGRRREAFVLYLPLVWASQALYGFLCSSQCLHSARGHLAISGKGFIHSTTKGSLLLGRNSRHVIPLFPECRTLQLNLNCLARYQYNKLKRSKAHSPTAALERCCPRGAVWGREWPPLSWAPRTICFRPPKPRFTNRPRIVPSTWRGAGRRGGPELEVQMAPGWKDFGREQAQRAAGPFATATPWRAVQQHGAGTRSCSAALPSHSQRWKVGVKPALCEGSAQEHWGAALLSPCTGARLRNTGVLLYFHLALVRQGAVFHLCVGSQRNGVLDRVWGSYILRSLS